MEKNFIDRVNNSFPEFGNSFGKEVALPVRNEGQSQYVNSEAEADSLLDMVFARNPRTGLPCGAVEQYMSEKLAPEVREFIRQNLMQENVAPPSNVVGFSDDDLMDMCRLKNETMQDYCHQKNQQH